jgi:hypothetical protein
VSALILKKGHSPSFYFVSVKNHRGSGTIAKSTGQPVVWYAHYVSGGLFGSGSRDKRFGTREEGLAWLAEQFGVVS